MSESTKKTPSPRGKAHTELRRQDRPEDEAQPVLKPRTPADKLPEAGEDGPDDLFNDMPV